MSQENVKIVRRMLVEGVDVVPLARDDVLDEEGGRD